MHSIKIVNQTCILIVESCKSSQFMSLKVALILYEAQEINLL